MTIFAADKYPPQRIQTLTAQEEIILKKTWAYIIKFLGYPLSINHYDVRYNESYIASTSTENFDESRVFVPVVTLSTCPPPKPLMGKVKGHDPETLPSDSERRIYIDTHASTEKYEKVKVPSDEYYYVFVHHYKANYERSREYSDLINKFGYDEPELSEVVPERSKNRPLVEDSDPDPEPDLFDNDNSSFVTACTSLSQFDDYPAHIFNPSKNGTASEELRFNSSQEIHVAKNNKRSSVYSCSSNRRTLPHGFKVKVTSCKTLHSCFPHYDPKVIHRALNKGTRNDLCDNQVLRFVRARKWDVDKAITMFFKSLDWRVNISKADRLLQEGDVPSYFNGKDKLFVKGMQRCKAWIKGTDRNNNPLFIIEVRKQLISESESEQNQKFFVTFIEWARLFVREVSEAQDKFTVLFDMTGFSLMKNADLAGAKTLAEMFEAHYPESLEFIIVHSAPWAAYKVYEIIKPWLDPTVASKIYFSKTYPDLTRFIDPKYIPALLGGENTDKPEYPVPTLADLSPPKEKDREYIRLKKERDMLFLRFFETTRKWIEATNPHVSELYLQDKLNLSIQLSHNFTKLDAYVRLRGVFDRNGDLNLCC
ncbi:uncharacterized protein SPAPADRAFT_157743 [Spathaspora passalidarum NRRL Y-27907]|uniref:CRAL-TRIO domain-containing protein n=1 Tax=Spathaspora passalidarum (strain NRRL Y-27907 / 11-Y1) TaxID=619300 RepID=G3AUJ9_SPAPN|nr:uncharacterized protein SPAPADRAFT_157743 [Spathaspora passalidarum NRRL Y-27907]EGW30555.1 hypothetical protein SPAPADRAFT_157743 [Spathaspora passalidarum NRRL Y-27907]